MDMSFEDQVRERAYHIWMSAGMEDGMAHEHWALAEQAVVAEIKPAKKAAAKKAVAVKAPAVRKTVGKTAAAKAAKAKH